MFEHETKKLLKLLGVEDQEYNFGDVITIRHRQYRFPGPTAMFDAARGNLGDYSIRNFDARPQG